MWRIKFSQIIFCSVSAITQLAVGIVFNSVSAIGQTIPDSSLGQESSTVTRTAIDDRLADLIEGGAVRDSNLFHSFEEFNVGEGEAVYFANPDGIANIFSRVTRNNVSQIFGTLGVQGAANLFLLNPNGIVFGENAALDLNGSFLATTADSYVFGEAGAKFSASESSAAPLLKIDLTPGLQMGENPGQIIVEGNGHMLTGGTFFPLQNSSSTVGLQIASEQTLGLIAGEIKLDGGIIKTLGGNIELASVKQGNVYLDLDSASDRLNFSEVEEFGDLKLFNKALLDTSGALTGNINLTAANISLADASAAIIQNLGVETSGKITLNATNLVELAGSLRNAPDTPTPFGIVTGIAYSRLTTETLGLGTAGDIAINSFGLSLDEGGYITSRTFSNANTGNINVDVSGLIEINSYSSLSPSFLPSIITTATFGSGDAGKISVSTKNIHFLDGGTIASNNFSSGKGGEVQIDVEEDIIVSGINPETLNPSGIASWAFRMGDSGSVTINTARLSIFNRGVIGTSTLAEGSAGQLTINATEYIKVTGPDVDDPKFAFSNSVITSNGAILDPVLRQITGAPDIPSGNSGNLFLNTPTLTVSDGAEISVSNYGLGDSGNLQIDAERVFLDNKGTITAFSTTGQGGNIELYLKDSLLLTDKSSITAENLGTFTNSQMDVDGGNISIDADTVTLLKMSQINADAFEGDGGNINITTQGLFVSNDSSIAATSEFGLDGNVDVEIINQEGYLELEKLPENLTNVSQQITRTCSAKDSKFAIAGRGGLPENPGQNLRGQAVWQDLRLPKIKSNLASEKVSVESLPDRISPVLREANSWQITPHGNVKLLARDRHQTNFLDKALNCTDFATR